MKRSRHEYVNGRLHGAYKQWYRSGLLAQEGNYQQGRLHGRTTAYRDGPNVEPIMRISYEKGRKKGTAYQRNRRNIELTVEKATATSKLVLRGTDVVPHAKRLAYLSTSGAVDAVDIDEVIDFLGQILNPAEVEAYLSMLNSVYDQLGFDTADGLLLKCSTGLTALPIGGGGPSSPTMPTAAELSQFSEACQAQTAGNIGFDPATAGDPAWQSYVAQQTAYVESLFDNCVDTTNPLVTAVPVTLVDAVVDAVIEAVKTAIQVAEALSDVQDAVVDAVDTIEQSIDEKVEHTLTLVQAAVDHPDRAVAAAALIVGFYGLKALSSEPDPGDLEHEIGMHRVSDAIWERAEEWLLEGNVGDLSNLGGPGRPVGPPGGFVEDMAPGAGADCADLLTWWANVKAYCDTADWRTIECQQFLGASADCLERVLPGPDGDPVCSGATNDPESAADWARAVRQRICEMTANGTLVSDGFGNEICQSPEHATIIAYDPCQDPVAQWTPDQCLDATFRELQAAQPEPRADRSTLTRITPDDLDGEHEAASGPILVAFTATNCGPCHRVVDMLTQFEDEYSGRLRFSQIDIHQHPELATKFNIRHTPTLTMFMDGERVGERRVGAASPERLMRYIDKTLTAVNSL